MNTCALGARLNIQSYQTIMVATSTLNGDACGTCGVYENTSQTQRTCIDDKICSIFAPHHILESLLRGVCLRTVQHCSNCCKMVAPESLLTHAVLACQTGTWLLCRAHATFAFSLIVRSACINEPSAPSFDHHQHCAMRTPKLRFVM